MDLELVSRTALWTAAGRAWESQRTDRLFDDPLASVLAGPEGQAMLSADPIEAQNTTYLAIRTRFFDEWLMDVVQQGVSQIVLLGAGMDTRAFRLVDLKDVILWEVDQLPLLNLKDSRLNEMEARPLCDRRTVAVDIGQHRWLNRLTESGLRLEAPVVWVAEGFFTYLEESTVLDILTHITDACSTTTLLGFDAVSKDFLTSGFTRRYVTLLQKRGTPFKFATNSPEALLRDYGWTVDAVLEPGQTAYGRRRWPWPLMPRSTPNVPRSFLITAHRQ